MGFALAVAWNTYSLNRVGYSSCPIHMIRYC